jgi:hypothetical protein
MTHVFRPSARIEIAGQELSAAEAGLQRLAVSLALGGHARADLGFWPRSKFAGARPGDAATIALGAAGEEETVLTGTVTAVRQGRDTLGIEVMDPGATLSLTRRTLIFEETAIDEIVSRLAAEADVSVEADAAGDLAIYYVDPARPLWNHLRGLAALSGSDLFSAADGTLLFRQPGGGASHTLRHGAELLDWRIAARPPSAAIAAGAHGDKSGSGTWHWVAPDPLGDAPEPTRIHGVLADVDGADAATQAAKSRVANAAFGGHVVLSGAAEIRPADSAVLEDIEGGDPDPLRILRVRHSLDGDRGFLTVLDVEGGGAGGGLLGGLSL